MDEAYLAEVNQLIRTSNFFVIDAVQLVTAYHASPALFLHADNHFNSREIQEKVVAIDIRKPDAEKEIRMVI